MSKNLISNSSPTKLKDTILDDEEEEIYIENNNDDYEKEANSHGINNIDNATKKDANNINNNNIDTHNAIKQRLLKMEAETKKITQMQNKYENLTKNKNNNVNNDNDNIDNENDEIIEIYSNSSNNYIESNEDGQLPSPSHKSKTSNSTGGASNSNSNVMKSSETSDENNSMSEYPSGDDQKMLDERSIFINNLHTDTTASELQQLFATCGTIERITIVCDKWTGKPKGCSYIQFKSKESIDNAMILNGREVKGKIISVEQKRTNLPKWMRGRGRGRGRVMPGRGRIAGRAYFMPPFYGPPPMMPMCPSYGYFRGRGYRSRGYWQPY